MPKPNDGRTLYLGNHPACGSSDCPAAGDSLKKRLETAEGLLRKLDQSMLVAMPADWHWEINDFLDEGKK